MPRFSPVERRFAGRGFTLVEVLVVLTILMLVSTLMFVTIQNASSTISTSDSRQESLGQARQALDRIGADIASQLRRDDIFYGYAPSGASGDFTGNDELAFYTEASSYDGNRSLSLVHYRVNPATGELERGVLGVNWDDPLSLFLPSGQKGEFHNQLPAVADGSFQVLSAQIFRFEVCFLSVDENGVQELNSYPPARIGNLLAIVVGVAVLDGRSRAIVTPQQMESVAGRLPDPVLNQTPAAAWQSVLDSGNFGSQAGIPQSAASQIRVYQKYFPVQ